MRLPLLSAIFVTASIIAAMGEVAPDTKTSVRSEGDSNPLREASKNQFWSASVFDLVNNPDIVGKRVRIEVEILIERDVPLAVVIGSDIGIGRPQRIHLVTATGPLSELKQGQRYFIEGMVVDGPHFSSYTVYYYGFYRPEPEKTVLDQKKANKSEMATPRKPSD